MDLRPDSTADPAVDPAVDAQLVAAKGWLWSDDGRASAEGVLHRRRFGLQEQRATLSSDDLRADAFRAFWERVRRHGPVEDLDPAAYLTRTMQNLVLAACRGRVRLAPLDHPDVERHLVAAAEPVDDPVLHLGTGDDLEAVRAAIEAAAAPTWVRAGALVYVTVLAHPDAVPDDHPVPRPERGARPDEAALWIALWFAGRRDGLFPDRGAAPDARMRQARSRAGRQIRDLVSRTVSATAADRYARRSA